MVRQTVTIFATALLLFACGGTAPAALGSASAREEADGTTTTDDGDVATAIASWSDIEANAAEAQNLLDQKEYQAAYDLADKAIGQLDGYVTFASADQTDQDTTRMALKRQIRLSIIQIKAAKALRWSAERIQQVRDQKTLFEQNLKSMVGDNGEVDPNGDVAIIDVDTGNTNDDGSNADGSDGALVTTDESDA